MHCKNKICQISNDISLLTSGSVVKVVEIKWPHNILYRLNNAQGGRRFGAIACSLCSNSDTDLFLYNKKVQAAYT